MAGSGKLCRHTATAEAKPKPRASARQPARASPGCGVTANSQEQASVTAAVAKSSHFVKLITPSQMVSSNKGKRSDKRSADYAAPSPPGGRLWKWKEAR